MAETTPVALEPSDDELRTVFGRNAGYYLAQWHGTARRRVNWAAFFLSGFWLPYRRMYFVTGVFYVALFVETWAEELVFASSPNSVTARLVERLSGLVAAGICGAWGNRWYMAHVAEANREGADGAPGR